MKVITLTQPWATLVAIGAKKIETRSWATNYRGLLAIHAAKGLGSVVGKEGLRLLCREEPFRTALEPLIGTDVSLLPLGAIIAVTELVDCRPTRIDCGLAFYQRAKTGIWWQVSSQERAFGDYSDGRYAWLLCNVQRLKEPIGARGALGLWDYDTAAILTMIGQ